MEPPIAPQQYIRAKYALVRLIQNEPTRFVETIAQPMTPADLASYWDSLATDLPPEECGPGDGFSVRTHGPADRPMVFVTLPTCHRRNSAVYVAALPTDTPDLRFRVFTLERALLPSTSEPLVFLVEWVGDLRHNFGPPSMSRLNDDTMPTFASALLAITDGERKPLATTDLRQGTVTDTSEKQ